MKHNIAIKEKSSKVLHKEKTWDKLRFGGMREEEYRDGIDNKGMNVVRIVEGVHGGKEIKYMGERGSSYRISTWRTVHDSKVQHFQAMLGRQEGGVAKGLIRL